MTVDFERLLNDPDHRKDQLRSLFDKARDKATNAYDTLTHDKTYTDGQRDVTERYLRYLQSQPCTKNDVCRWLSDVNAMCLRCRLEWFMNAESRNQHAPVK